jgi:hypothetical protein
MFSENRHPLFRIMLSGGRNNGERGQVANSRRLTVKSIAASWAPAANDLLRRWPVSKQVNRSRAPDDDPTPIEPLMERPASLPTSPNYRSRCRRRRQNDEVQISVARARKRVRRRRTESVAVKVLEWS